METRKLISFGSSSYVISIPKAWVEENKLGKGSSIFINELPGELVISPTNIDQKKTKEKQIDGANKTIDILRIEIIAHYLNYYDTIEIRNLKEDQIANVKLVIKELAGMEIIEQTANKIIAKDLINIKEVSIKTLIRRIDIIVRSMIDDLISVIGKKDCEKMQEILFQRDRDVNRLYFLVRRVTTAALEDPRIAKMFETNPLELVSDWEIVLELEKIGDVLKRITRCLSATQTKTQIEELEKIIPKLKQKYLEMLKAYYLHDVKVAYSMEEDCKQLIKSYGLLLELFKAKFQEKTHNDEHVGIVGALEQCKEMARSIRKIARSLIMTSPNLP